jgi:hypothetical protein
MAKLDFFARYPDFFEVARNATEPAYSSESTTGLDSDEAVESAMVRHHYGPWDKRYYHVLAYLEAKRLISVIKKGNSYQIALTGLGGEHAKMLAGRPSFLSLVARMREIKKIYGPKKGTFLKKLIYRLFDAEVSRRPLGEVIHR